MNQQAKEPVRSRRWYQFSLRTLLIFMLVSGTALGFFGIQWQAARRQEEAIVAIKAAGGVVYYDYEYDANGNYLASAPPPAPAWLIDRLGVDFFASVYNVEINKSTPYSPWGSSRNRDKSKSTEIDQAVSHLGTLKKLRWLDLIGLELSDVNLGPLSQLTQLERLDFHGSDILDQQLQHLAGLTKLASLGLADCKITDDGISHLKNLRELKALNLSGTSVADQSLTVMEQFASLEVVALQNTLITDAGLERFLKKVQPRSLYVSGTSLTDDSIDALLKVRPLSELDMDGTAITEVGYRRLSNGLTPCKVILSVGREWRVLTSRRSVRLNDNSKMAYPMVNIAAIHGKLLQLSAGSDDGLRLGNRILIKRGTDVIAKGAILEAAPLRSLARLTEITEREVLLTDTVSIMPEDALTPTKEAPALLKEPESKLDQ